MTFSTKLAAGFLATGTLGIALLDQVFDLLDVVFAEVVLDCVVQLLNPVLEVGFHCLVGPQFSQRDKASNLGPHLGREWGQDRVQRRQCVQHVLPLGLLCFRFRTGLALGALLLFQQRHFLGFACLGRVTFPALLGLQCHHRCTLPCLERGLLQPLPHLQRIFLVRRPAVLLCASRLDVGLYAQVLQCGRMLCLERLHGFLVVPLPALVLGTVSVDKLRHGVCLLRLELLCFVAVQHHSNVITELNVPCHFSKCSTRPLHHVKPHLGIDGDLVKPCHNPLQPAAACNAVAVFLWRFLGHVANLSFGPCPQRHQASFLLCKDRVLSFCGPVLLGVWPVVQPTVLPSGLTGDGSNCTAGEQANVRLPCVLLSLGTEARSFQSVTKGIMHGSEQVVGQHLCHLAVQSSSRPFNASIHQHWVVAYIKVARTKSIRSRKYSHLLIVPNVAHRVPRRTHI